jgi:hypothetical protein
MSHIMNKEAIINNPENAPFLQDLMDGCVLNLQVESNACYIAYKGTHQTSLDLEIVPLGDILQSMFKSMCFVPVVQTEKARSYSGQANARRNKALVAFMRNLKSNMYFCDRVDPEDAESFMRIEITITRKNPVELINLIDAIDPDAPVEPRKEYDPLTLGKA